jgi:hypothetical protein
MRRLDRVVVVLACAVASCGGKATAPFPGRVPANHRATMAACAPRVVGTTELCPAAQASAACATNRDCVEGGVNGRCFPGIRDTGGAGDAACACVFDRCASDADCAGHGPCQCAALEVGNSCLAGDCVIDADCGAGGYCSPVPDPCTGSVSGYRCHTPRDTCLDDTDCSSPCTYVAAEARWACVVLESCTVPTLPP